jgi:hypothetical protein
VTDVVAVYTPDDIESALVAWLTTPLKRADVVRGPKDPLPFTVVNLVTGSESVDMMRADPVVSVHTFCDKAAGFPAARDEAARTHARMLVLANGVTRVSVGDRVVSIESFEVVESPRWEFYSETVLRKVGRYRVGHSYVRGLVAP